MASTLGPPAVDRPDRRSPRSWTVGRVLTLAVIVFLVGFWAWILSGAPRKASPDRVTNRALIGQLDARCRSARQAIDALPAAPESKTAADRAAVVDQATTVLDRMLDDFDARVPPTGDDAVRFHGWLREWRLYLEDRRQYTARLRRDRRAQFLVDENKAGDSIDRSIQNFADVNDMPVCATPGDVG